MKHFDTLRDAAHQLHALCLQADIPPFVHVAYDFDSGFGAFSWNESEFGLFLRLDDFDLDAMTPDELRALWDEEEVQAEIAEAALAVAELN